MAQLSMHKKNNFLRGYYSCVCGVLATVLFFFTLVLPSEGSEPPVEIGIAWQGESLMVERVLSGLKNALNDQEVPINLDIRGNLPDLDSLDAVLTEFEQTKQGMVVFRSNGLELLMQRSVSIPAFFGAMTHPEVLGDKLTVEQLSEFVTGASFYIPAKYKLEIFQQVMPSIQSYLLLVEKGHPGSYVDARETIQAAEELGIHVEAVYFETLQEALDAVRMLSPQQGVILGSQALIMNYAAEIIQAAEYHPVFSYSEQPLEAGALGGFTVDAVMQGYTLGRMLVEVFMEGTPVYEIPVFMEPQP
ncbi:ABC transporter substrate binding protein, partial [Balneolaceae bacterium ANBcel3]|nr:ABC transporter substrate binding protein [Balneolaceae bacterium ANBcel3]